MELATKLICGKMGWPSGLRGDDVLEQIVGVDLGGTKFLMVCGDEVHQIRTGRGFSPQDLESNLKEFIAKLHAPPTGIGIALPGLVQGAERVVSCDVLPKMTGWSAAASFKGATCRIVLVNDVKAALAEEIHYAAPGITAGIVMVGTAVGAIKTSAATRGPTLRSFIDTSP